MTKANHPITVDEAQAALVSLDAAKSTTLSKMKPPLLLILLCSLSLGVITLGMSLMANNDLWHGLRWGAYVVICLSVGWWIVRLRIKGIIVKVLDVDISKKGLVSALVIMVVIMLSRIIYLEVGALIIPCIAAIVNTLTLAFCLHFDVRLNAIQKGINQQDINQQGINNE